MPKILKVVPHLSTDEMKKKLTTTKKEWLHKRWMIIYTAFLKPRACTLIAREFGLSAKTVRETIGNYNKLGVAGIETVGRGGRRNAHLALEEEKEFVNTFKKRAATGHFSTVHEINQAFEKKVGHPVGKSTIYLLLHRHGWRKLVPRSYHPKSNPEAKDVFKKNSQPLLKKFQKKKTTKINPYL